jgi:hypothetical protein
LNTRVRCDWISDHQLKKIHGFSEEATESEDLEAQTAQADAGKPPQEAFALQVLTSFHSLGEFSHLRRLWRPTRLES